MRRVRVRTKTTTMQLAQLSSVALLLALTPFSVVQTPAKEPAPDAKKQDKPERAKPKSAPEAEADAIRRDLLGAWQLTRFEMDGEDISGAACRGYLIVQGEFLSLDLQADSKYGHDLDYQGRLFSSGVQRWKYEASRLQLTTTALIGVGNFTQDHSVLYERTGTPRDYRVTFAGDSLTLERNSAWRLFFQRISKPAPPIGEPTDKPTDKK